MIDKPKNIQTGRQVKRQTDRQRNTNWPTERQLIGQLSDQLDFQRPRASVYSCDNGEVHGMSGLLNSWTSQSDYYDLKSDHLKSDVSVQLKALRIVLCSQTTKFS